mmetsp:Transcript_27702/g.108656  ORF Transcript_27702/g.108656 Transcript_27702/m.108656 type:complete len:92 (-) Transcript_27702:599-874(-)
MRDKEKSQKMSSFGPAHRQNVLILYRRFLREVRNKETYDAKTMREYVKGEFKDKMGSTDPTFVDLEVNLALRTLETLRSNHAHGFNIFLVK